MTNEEFQIKLQELTKNHRLREDLIKFKNQANNQLKAVQRRLKNQGYEELVEFMLPEAAESKKNCEKAAKRYEKEMINIVKEFPVYNWYTSIEGCSGCGYAMILAEAGDLRNYVNPGKLWKRMGLAVGQDGEAHKNKTKGLETGYSKRRRAIMYRIEDALVKNGKQYRDIYLSRKQYEMDRDAEGYNKERVEANKAKMMHFYPSSKAKIKEGQMPQFVLALRAQRYMSKELLKNLWIEWQGVVFDNERDLAV